MQETQEMQVWSLGQEDTLEGDLQYSFLGNLMSRGALWVTAHGVAELDMTEPVSTTYYYSFITAKGHKSESARKFLRDISPSTPEHIYTSCCQHVTVPMANQETSPAPQRLQIFVEALFLGHDWWAPWLSPVSTSQHSSHMTALSNVAPPHSESLLTRN